MSTETNPTPLRAPWTCHPSGVITDCEGRIVTVLTLGHDGCDDVRGRVIAKAPELHALLQRLVAIEGPRPGTPDWAAEVLYLLAEIEARPEFPSTLGGGQ